MSEKRRLPEWAPKNPTQGFATSVVGGSGPREGNQEVVRRPQRAKLSTENYVSGVLAGDRTILGRAITLVESNAVHHRGQAKEVLTAILAHSGNSVRVGISGVPGAGKSSCIERLGLMLTESGKRVAVLAIDPSSSISRGSILGDKTRMERLSQDPRCFIRPSPSAGVLGGVSRKTRETMLLCEAAGYDVILVETVGVGQSEAEARSMTDFFMLLTITGAGDELQSIKKGVLELADAIVINKADGLNKLPAERLRAEFNRLLPLLKPQQSGWRTKAYCCSALEDSGIAEIWEEVSVAISQAKEDGSFQRRRTTQTLGWVDSMVREGLEQMFFDSPQVSAAIPVLRQAVLRGAITPAAMAENLLEIFAKDGASFGVEKTTL